MTYHNYSGRATVFDMDIDVNNRYVATVGERRLNIFNIESGKPFRSYKPETAEELANGASSENAGGSLIKISLDPISGTFATTTGSDKAVRLFDLTMGTCVAKIIAHSELVTCVKFIETSDTEMRVVSTCSDGTIFIWRISDEVRNKMIGRANERISRARVAAALNTPLGARTLDPMSPLFDTPLDGLFGSDKSSPLLPLSSIDPSASNRSRRSSSSSIKGLTPAHTVSSNSSTERIRAVSLISNGETKYEEVYKKVAARRPRAESMGASTSTMPTSTPRSSIRLLGDRLPEITPSPSSSTPTALKSPTSPPKAKFPALPTWTKALRSKISPSTVTTGLRKSPTPAGPTLQARRLPGKPADSTATTPPTSKNATANGTGTNGSANGVSASHAHRVDRLHYGIPTKADKLERQYNIPPPSMPRRTTSPFKPVAKMGLAGHSVKKEGSKESLRNQAHTQASHRRTKSGIVEIKGSLTAGSSSMPDLINVPPGQVKASGIAIPSPDEDDEEDELQLSPIALKEMDGEDDVLEEMDEEAEEDELGYSRTVLEETDEEVIFLDLTETEADLEVEKYGTHLLDETRRNSTDRVSRNSLDSLRDGRETPVTDDSSNLTPNGEDDDSMTDDEETDTKVLEAYLRREPPPPSMSSRNFKRQSVAVGGGIGGISEIMAAALHPSVSMDMDMDNGDIRKVKKRQSFSAKFLSTLDITNLKHMGEEMPKVELPKEEVANAMEEARRTANDATEIGEAGKKPTDNDNFENLKAVAIAAEIAIVTSETAKESEERSEGESAANDVIALANEVVKELDAEPVTETAAMPVESKVSEVAYTNDEDAVAQEEIVKPSIDMTESTKELDTEPVTVLEMARVSEEEAVHEKMIEPSDTEPVTVLAIPVESKVPEMARVSEEEAVHEKMVEPSVEFDTIIETAIGINEPDTEPVTEAAAMSVESKVSETACANREEVVAHEETVEFDTVIKELDTKPVAEAAAIPVDTKPEVACAHEGEAVAQEDFDVSGKESIENPIVLDYPYNKGTLDDSAEALREELTDPSTDLNSYPVVTSIEFETARHDQPASSAESFSVHEDKDVHKVHHPEQRHHDILEIPLHAEVVTWHVNGVERDEDSNTNEAGVEDDLLQVLILIERSLGRYRRSIGNCSPREADIAKKIEVGLMRAADEIGKGLGAVALKTETENKKVLELVPASGAWVGDVDDLESSEMTEISEETEGKKSLEMGITKGKRISDTANCETTGLEIDLVEQAESKRASEPVIAHSKQVDNGVCDGAASSVPIENGDGVKIALTEEKVDLRPNGHHHDPGDYTLLLERYSDMLVRMVKDKMETQAETI